MRFLDLQAQRERIDDDLQERIARVLEHGQYVMGPEVAELEEALSRYVGVTHTVSCASGTDALLMALMAHDVGPGDAIITTPFTFVATAEVVALLGARPVFVDVEPETFNLDPSGLGAAMEECQRLGLRARGVIPVDLFGLPADYPRIEDFAAEHGLFVLEDAAQSLGGEAHGRKAGAHGHVAATSFFPAKPLGCFGDGGAVFTDDGEMADRLRSIRIHGQGSDKYENVRLGITGRLDTLQAAILLAKLPILDDEIRSRERIARRYNEALGDVARVPRAPAGYASAWAQYTIVHPRRDALQRKLADREVPTAIYYARPLHLQPAFASLEQGEGTFPVSEELSRSVLSLPVQPYLDEREVEAVIEAVQTA